MRARTSLLCLLLGALLLSGCAAPGPDASRGGPPATPFEWDDGTAQIAMFQVDVQRRGHLPDAAVPDDVVLDWVVRGINKGDHTAAKGSAVFANGKILVGADTGTLYAFDTEGRFLWGAVTHPSANGIHGTPAVHDDVVYVGAYDGAMYAFALADGASLWRTQIGGSIGSSPLWYGDRIFVSVETPRPSGIMAVLNATTGEILWRDDGITDHPHSSVALDPEAGVFVVGANDGILYGWDLETYERRWTTHQGGAIKGPVLLHDGYAYFGSWDGHVHRVDVRDGRIDWTFAAEGKVMPGPALDVDRMVLYTGSHDGNVYALDARDGEEVWRKQVHGWVIGSPLVAGDKVLAGSYDGHLYALDKADGAEVWHFKTNGRVTATPLVVGDRVIFAERAGESVGSLWVLGPRSAA